MRRERLARAGRGMRASQSDTQAATSVEARPLTERTHTHGIIWTPSLTVLLCMHVCVILSMSACMSAMTSLAHLHRCRVQFLFRYGDNRFLWRNTGNILSPLQHTHIHTYIHTVHTYVHTDKHAKPNVVSTSATWLFQIVAHACKRCAGIAQQGGRLAQRLRAVQTSQASQTCRRA